MSNRRERIFKLLIYESEYRQIQAWTNKHQDVETGGDLFGLWLDERTAVIQLVVGPGKQCRRTSTSFYQDTDYLKRMGDALTLEEGLCHIGEWHSHHRLNIPRPSSGDESTVWSNMDRYGLSRFFLLIANISTTWNWTSFSLVPCDIMVNGFLFEVGHQRQRRRRLPVLEGQFTFLRGGSPFRSKYFDMIEEGAESMNIEIECRDQSELELKKRCQEIQETLKEFEASLIEERNSHDETRRQLCISEQRSNELERALAAERQLKKETERNLKEIQQRLQIYEMERHAAAETKAIGEIAPQWQKNEQMWHAYSITVQETEKRLQSSQQRANELQTALIAQMQEREDIAQRSHELRRSLVAERQAREEAERRLHSSQQRSRELETDLVEQKQAKEDAEIRLHKSQLRASELKTALAEEQNAHEETKRDLIRSSKLENNTSTVQQNIVEHNSSRDASCIWSLSRSEITKSNSLIREGKWGHVVEGRFQGRKVAVMVVHPYIVPFLDQSVLQREMRMAHNFYHPCLMQLIGVSYSQSLLFVTELLETNLRAVLQERALLPSEISTIALDVAEGLNYLHCKSSAAPIVHQEISSANVLLWKEGDNWRAKVSDCIAEKCLQQSMAVSPFDVRYAAPETQIPPSPKMDVYSFGVLLCEMNIRFLPEDVIQRNSQINSLSYHYKWLIKDCLRENPNRRPSIDEIIRKLEAQWLFQGSTVS